MGFQAIFKNIAPCPFKYRKNEPRHFLKKGNTTLRNVTQENFANISRKRQQFYIIVYESLKKYIELNFIVKKNKGNY